MSDITKQLFALLEKQPQVNKDGKDIDACLKDLPSQITKNNVGASFCLAALLAYGSREIRAFTTPDEYGQFSRIMSNVQARFMTAENTKRTPALAGVVYRLRQEGKM